jgi:hypothetical protein
MAKFPRKQQGRDQNDWGYTIRSSPRLQDNNQLTQRDRETTVLTVRARRRLCSEEDDDVLAYPPVYSKKKQGDGHKNLE